MHVTRGAAAGHCEKGGGSPLCIHLHTSSWQSVTASTCSNRFHNCPCAAPSQRHFLQI